MKKQLFLTLVLIYSVNIIAFAQLKPEKGFTCGLQFSPFIEQPFSTINFNGRYFSSKKSVLRCNFNFMFNTSKIKTENNSFYNITERKNELTFGIVPGFEHHFGNFEKVSLYLGMQAGYINHSTKSIIKSKNDSENITFKVINIDDDNNQNGYHKCLYGIFIGTDIFIWKGLYAGAEFGIDFSCKIMKKGYTQYYISTPYESTTPSPVEFKSNIFHFNFTAVPQIRLGWKFKNIL